MQRDDVKDTDLDETKRGTDVVIQQLKSYDENGFLVLERTVSEHLLDQLRAIAEAKLAEQHPTFTLLSKRHALSVHDVPVARAIFEEFCTRNRDLLVEIVGGGALVTDMSVLIAEAGSDAQTLHTDCRCVEGEECNVLIPLEPLTTSNGPTEFVPGSQWGKKNDKFKDSILESDIRQRTDRLAWTLKSRNNLRLAMQQRGRKRTVIEIVRYPLAQGRRLARLTWNRRRGNAHEIADADIQQFIARKGDALVYSASLIHRGGSNRSDRDRLVLGVLIKERRNNRSPNVEYFEGSHDDFYTANMKDCGTVREYFSDNGTSSVAM